MSEASPWFIAIGASGPQGLDDVRALLAGLPAEFSGVVMIVLHRPWDRLSHLRDVLGKAARLPVIIASDGERLTPGNVYIGEPADHLTLVARSFGKIIPDPSRLQRNRTVDLLFDSVADCGGDRIIGVVLSGGLDDGSRGLAKINAAGGLAMVLTPNRAVAPGMPENAIDYDGPIDVIGSPTTIAEAICRAVEGPLRFKD